MLADGTDLRFGNAIRFPALDELLAALDRTGFELERGYGDWDRSPLGANSPELILVANTTV